jgi:predicted dienelactone hydrolase
MNNLIDLARYLPTSEAVTTVSISPIVLPAPERRLPLEMRPSKDGYSPLVNFYAEQGFAVIQPTHASSKVAGLAPDAPGAPLFWRERVEEMKLILDQLNEIEGLAPAIAGRLDHERIAAVGHSMGAQTVGMLLGARLTDPKDENARDVNLIEPRIKAGVLMAEWWRRPQRFRSRELFGVESGLLAHDDQIIGGVRR